MDVSALLQQDRIVLDGGFGTELLRRGFPFGEETALAVFSHPDLVRAIHADYAAAGAQILYADTFGANPIKLDGSGHTTAEAVAAAVRLAREASGGKVPVALDVSTLGKLLEPAGDLTYEAAYDAYREVMLAGVEAGVDCVALETFTDLRECRIALLAAKENTDLPVFATVTVNEDGKTMNGSTAGAAALTLSAAGADAVGVNCSFGPDRLGAIVDDLLACASVPVIVKPNAGLPDPATGRYTMDDATFADLMAGFAARGVRILGGCCGTTPATIAALAALPAIPAEAAKCNAGVICGTGAPLSLNEPRLVGERINPTGKKKLRAALQAGDFDTVVALAQEQVAAGAEILDVNVGAGEIDEKAAMVKAVKLLQAAVDVPLQLDSPRPDVLEAGLRVYTGKALVNSVNGSEESLEKVLPIVKRYGAAVIGLTLDDDGIPKTAEKRVEIASRIIDRAERAGIPRSDIAIDCLAMTVSAQQDAAAQTLAALKIVRETFGVGAALGVSNISFGLPARETVNAAFLAAALEDGLTLPIMNPNSDTMRGVFRAFKVLRGYDAGSVAFIADFGGEETAAPAPAAEMTVGTAIEKGLAGRAAELCKAALVTRDTEDVINAELIPALDRVGAAFEAGRYFLPQLMRAADAASACFDLIRQKMADAHVVREPKGKILLATVKGDIHDIGKNIVKAVLENYGYEVIDLGKNVEPAAVVEAQREQNVPLVGLSALMTTTLPAMAETVRALREAGAACKVMVGGAVLTPEYAAEIGADYYGRDAKAAADIAKEVFGK